MKFLAILKDSLREAIDTKVFYVMVGFSAFLTLVTLTMSFKPRSGAQLLQLAGATMMVNDSDDLRLERLMERAKDPDFRGYAVTASEPLENLPDGGPDSPYRLTLMKQCNTEAEAAENKANPAATIDRIKERLGKLDDMRLLDVQEARLAPAGTAGVPPTPAAKEVYFEVKVKPTPAARRLWPHEPSLFFGALPLSFLAEVPLAIELYILEDYVIGGFGAWVAILVSIIITAFFIPNMLRKGTVDLLLVKPINRPVLLLYKYVGGLTFIFLNTAVAVGGIWLAIGLRSGLWAPSFLLTIFVLTAFFAILYSVSTLFAVLTRSPIVAILLTAAVWGMLFVVGVLYQMGEKARQNEERRATAHKVLEESGGKPEVAPPGDDGKGGAKSDRAGRRPGEEPELPFRSDNWFFSTVRVIHFVLPRTSDLSLLNSRLLVRDLLTGNQVKTQKIDDTQVSWGESLTVSGLFVAVMLGLACFRFATKDY